MATPHRLLTLSSVRARVAKTFANKPANEFGSLHLMRGPRSTTKRGQGFCYPPTTPPRGLGQARRSIVICAVLLGVTGLSALGVDSTAPTVSRQIEENTGHAAPDLGDAPHVLVEIHEGDFPPRAWPESLVEPVERYRESAFGFFHVPWRYTATGVRDDRPSPFLLRASATITVPPGRYQVLIRARSAARLWRGDELLASLDFPPSIQDGHDPVRHDALQLGFTRWVAPGDHETLVEFTSDGQPQSFVYEIIVGGHKGNERLRTEVGESLVAMAPVDGQEFYLLAPGPHVPLTDAGWETYRADRQAFHDQLEAERRQAAFATQREYWEQRHRLAAEFAATRPVIVPPPHDTLPANDEIDHFLNGSIAHALENSSRPLTDVTFHRDVQPILQKHCSACHGGQPQGGLRLDSRTAALQGGDSGLPAISPGKPELSALLERVLSEDPDVAMPMDGERLSNEEVDTIRDWIAAGAEWPDVAPRKLAELPPLTSDAEFLRRIFLDVTGTIPTLSEAREFLSDRRPDKRERWIDRLLDDPRWADGWMPYWLDVLAENPNLVNPTLNSTGPFRWWLHDALRDHKPWDVVVTELIQMEGSERGGGPAGFGLAALNDAPFAAKAGILSSALLAVDMKCARCHDAPYHSTQQADLFHLAAMLARESLEVPQTSTVALDSLPSERTPRIRVTLKPGVPIEPQWTLTNLVSAEPQVPLPQTLEEDPRARLAALVTQPSNERFAQVLVNRAWRRYFGRGLMEPVDDWESGQLSHPELLEWLARDFIAHGYDLRHLARRILNSHAYQRQSSHDADANMLFAAPARRRLGPEQMVDVLHDAVRVPYDTEPLCLDLDAGRPQRLATNLGQPRRAWQFAYLANDRDRPSLNLPRAQVVTELLTSFGWNGDRQEPVSDRVAQPSLLQSALLAHGATMRRLVRLTDEAFWTKHSLEATSPEELVESTFWHVLTREPTGDERALFVQLLSPGFATRAVQGKEPQDPSPPRRTQPYITWANHLVEDANRIRLAEEEEVRRGPPVTGRLTDDWRERMEDLLWALLNSPEMVYIP